MIPVLGGWGWGWGTEPGVQQVQDSQCYLEKICLKTKAKTATKKFSVFFPDDTGLSSQLLRRLSQEDSKFKACLGESKFKASLGGEMKSKIWLAPVRL